MPSWTLEEACSKVLINTKKKQKYQREPWWMILYPGCWSRHSRGNYTLWNGWTKMNAYEMYSIKMPVPTYWNIMESLLYKMAGPWWYPLIYVRIMKWRLQHLYMQYFRRFRATDLRNESFKHETHASKTLWTMEIHIKLPRAAMTNTLALALQDFGKGSLWSPESRNLYLLRFYFSISKYSSYLVETPWNTRTSHHPESQKPPEEYPKHRGREEGFYEGSEAHLTVHQSWPQHSIP